MPDVDAAPQAVVISQDEPTGVKKWLIASLISAGVLVVAGIVVFAVYAYMTGTPKYMLNAAMTNLVASPGQAGTFAYESLENGKSAHAVDGDFLTYADPTNAKNHAVTISAGHSAARVGVNALFFNDGNAVQFVGLGNVGRLFDSMGFGVTLSKDSLVRLGSLDSQWYSQTANDVWQLKPVTSQHTLQGTANSSVIDSAGQLYAKNPFITVLHQYGDEPINDVKSMHLSLGVDRNKLGDYLRALKSEQSNTIMLTDDDIAKITTSEVWNHLTTEVWIARSDRTFRQVKLTLTNDQTKQSQTFTVVLHSEQVATARQAVTRPESAKSFSTFVDAVIDIGQRNAADAH